MILWQKQAFFSQNIAGLIKFMDSQGFGVILGEAYIKPQTKVSYGRNTQDISSMHIQRLAIDINLIDKDGIWVQSWDRYEPFGEYWETLHRFNRWGGRFTQDKTTHFEMQNL